MKKTTRASFGTSRLAPNITEAYPLAGEDDLLLEFGALSAGGRSRGEL